MKERSWQDRAVCKGADEGWFFNDLEDEDETPKEGPHLLHLGKRLCEGCPVKIQCLDDGMRFDQPGIRAGTDQQDRQKLTRFRAKNAVFFNSDMARILDTPLAEIRRRHTEESDLLAAA